MSAKQIHIRLLVDGRYGKAGEIIWLDSEKAEALVVNNRAEIFPKALNASLTHRPGANLKGGVDSKGAD